MPKVRFLKEKREIEVGEGANLRQEALTAGIPVYRFRHRRINCGGRGKCGTCRVLIVRGAENTSPMGKQEQRRLSMSLVYTGYTHPLRLSCMTKVTGDIEVETQPPLNMHGEAFWE